MNKKMIVVIIALVFLVGCDTQQKNEAQHDEEMMNPSKNAITYNCDGEIVKVDFNNDLEPKTADLYFVEKNIKLTLPNTEAASGARYSDEDVEFWTHQGEAKLTTKETNKSLNCTEESNKAVNEIVDENGNTVTPGCKVWFDGCNTCHVGDSDMSMACTKKLCAPEIMKEAHCLDNE